jgi:release factor glutamine methyltransferase
MPDLATRLPMPPGVSGETTASAASLVTLGAERLRQRGVPDARWEALQLWADLRDTTSASALLEAELSVGDDIRVEFSARIERRAAGEPRAYVSRAAGFRHLVLACDRRALIPRPETEGLVDLLLERVRTGVVADIGTGTGCIALSLTTEGSFSEVVAVDRSAEALTLAQANWASMGADPAAGVNAAVRFVQSDLAAAVRSAALDALVSNPPYLTEREYAALDSSVRDWEPAMALVSGADGLDATTRLLEDGRRVLRPGGWLALEVDCTRAAAAARRAAVLGWRDIGIYNDLFGRERYLLARRSDNS